jgi:hypothetical protein
MSCFRVDDDAKRLLNLEVRRPGGDTARILKVDKVNHVARLSNGEEVSIYKLVISGPAPTDGWECAESATVCMVVTPQEAEMLRQAGAMDGEGRQIQ